jgi:hypothetical protein
VLRDLTDDHEVSFPDDTRLDPAMTKHRSCLANGLAASSIEI